MLNFTIQVKNENFYTVTTEIQKEKANCLNWKSDALTQQKGQMTKQDKK